jgi:3-oxoadipate enol-lactonase
MWDLQIPALSANYQVIVYDLRGHGKSDSPDHPYSIDLLADDLHHFLPFLCLKRSVLLGLSLGGRILLKFALKYPEEARAIILAGAQSETSAEAATLLQALAEIARREGMEKATEIFSSLPLLQTLAKRHPERFQREKERIAKISPVGFARTCLAIARMESLNEQLSAIKAPTLALTGEEDDPYLPYLDLYALKIPDCKKRVIPRAGHLSNLENPEAFIEVVRSFLNGLENIEKSRA